MKRVATRPRIETPIVIPDVQGDQYRMFEWLKKHARQTGRADLIHQIKEQGNCESQTITKVMELAKLLGVPISQTIFTE